MSSVMRFDEWQDSNGVPVASALLGTGKILQIVEGSTSVRVDVASTTFADTGLSATITPSSTTSKILVVVNQHMGYSVLTSTSRSARFRLLRDATTLETVERAPGARAAADGSGEFALFTTTNRNFLDSPNTTSAVTYKTQISVGSTANSAVAISQLDTTSAVSRIFLLEVAA